MERIHRVHGKIRTHKILLGMTLIILVLSSALAYALVYITKTINFSASIKTSGNIGAYSDLSCTIPMTSYDFGEFDVASSDVIKTVSVYLKNIGNVIDILTWSASPFDSVIGNTYYKASDWTLTATYNSGTPFNAEGSTTPTKINVTVGQVVTVSLELIGKRYALGQTFPFTASFKASDS